MVKRIALFPRRSNYFVSANVLTIMRRMLLIVDPQYDFITGSLAVAGAEEAMNSLANYITDNDGKYEVKVLTADSHPANHMSFVENGGLWNAHCIEGTPGAAIWQPLMRALLSTSGDTILLKKGTDTATEEYSIFKNSDAAVRIKEIIRRHGIDIIDLCGIAGDVCVLDTLNDGRRLLGDGMFNVLTDYSPSIDGGASLQSAINSLQEKGR